MKKLYVVVAALIILIGGAVIYNMTATNRSEGDEQNLSSSNEDTHDDDNLEALGEQIDLTNQMNVSMDIADFKYEMPNIKVRVGTTVTWTNQDTVKHNVMREHDDDDVAHDPPTIDEVDPDEFVGPLLAKGESYSFTFKEVSASPYHCSPHPDMKGSVTVVE